MEFKEANSLFKDLPTRGVIAEVKTELLCTMKVIPAPTMIAMYPVTQPKGKGKSEIKQKRQTGAETRGSKHDL